MGHRDIDHAQQASDATAGARLLAANGRWPADVEVWHVPLEIATSPAETPFLDESERARAMRYRQPADRVRFATTRSVLRVLLASYMRINPDWLTFVATARGRPELAGAAGGAVSFNVSHAGDHALIAVSRRRRVGIDIERLDRTIDWRELATLVCTDSERGALEGAAAEQQAVLFFRCWTAKESLLKALGLGITEGLQALSFDLKLDEAEGACAHVTRAEFADARALACRWLDDVPGYVGCLAYDKANR